MVDVLECEPWNRSQDLPWRLIDALPLVQTARIVVGDDSIDRLLELQPPVPNQLRDELEYLDHLEVKALAEVRRIVLGEVDVVVRLDGDDPVRSDRTPIGHVM